ncbi:thiol-disulfide oxidoreductase DCC family protein [Limoniibacter endophyticus]|uniref:thiol-disulfide oxidoreductase DCC family protein n=1 Tax=Limoniibacter endophyticus TaxID=1565040 RepID=UPI0016753CF0
MNSVLIFDAECVLCSSWIHFILRHERDASISFVSALSKTGLDQAEKRGLDRSDLQNTFLLIKNGQALMRSDAVLALVSHLKFPWSFLGSLRLVPLFIRDGIYERIARNRYRWFDRKQACFVPPAHARYRFIDE